MKSSPLLLIAAGFCPIIAAASGVDALCSGSAGLSDGQWARFAIDTPFMNERLESRYAIVGMEGSDYWLEYEVAMPMSNGATIVKVLIPAWPFKETDVKRAMMQLPMAAGIEPMPPMELPPSGIQKSDLLVPIQMGCEELKNGVEESVTVTAGTFSATRISLRRLGKDIWLSADVPFGIVKLADSNDQGMELIAFGEDAEPAITAAPQKFPGMDTQ